VQLASGSGGEFTIAEHNEVNEIIRDLQPPHAREEILRPRLLLVVGTLGLASTRLPHGFDELPGQGTPLEHLVVMPSRCSCSRMSDTLKRPLAASAFGVETSRLADT
jgi:hypothetical protein